MKKFAAILLLVIFIAMFSYPALAQEEQKPTVFLGPFAVGQDNGIYAGIGERGFAASGVGVNIASAYDGLIYLRGSLLVKWIDSPLSTVFPAATIGVDVVKLVTKRGTVTILVPELSLLIGPSVAYVTSTGKAAPGICFNLNYQF